MSTEAALLEAIRLNPDEDTPRLAYADWLDENAGAAGRAGSTGGGASATGSRPDRAAFIRVQCRLAELSPADPDWPDLAERERELAARLGPRKPELEPPEPERFYNGLYFLSEYEEPFRRGFPYFIDCQIVGSQWTAGETTRVAADLTNLIGTTTVRGFHPYSIAADRLAELMAAPAFAELSGLALTPHSYSDWNTGGWEADFAAVHRLIATSPATRRVWHLALYGKVLQAGAQALATATSLDAVRRLTVQEFENVPPADLERLTSAAWFGRLRHFRSSLADPAAAARVLPALGQLPDLHTLDLAGLWGPSADRLAAAFPSLGRLVYRGALDRDEAATLAGVKFPRLAVFEAPGLGLKNDAFAELLKVDWFPRLRVLNLSKSAIGDRSVAALAAHPAAGSLQVLRLGDNPFGRTGLAAIGNPGAFPELVSLDLHSYTALKRKPTEADVVAFLARLQLPRLRHLDLSGWPAGDGGARVIASSPAFSGLTRLSLEGCSIGDPGAQALLASPHLQNLAELRLDYNAIQTGADALADPAVMPRLGECWLISNQIPPASAERIKAARRAVI